MKPFCKNLPHGLASFKSTLFVAIAVILSANTAWCEGQRLQDETDMTDDTAPVKVETFRQTAIYTGYRFITPIDNPATAVPYQRLKSGIIGGFSAATIGADLKLSADAQFLHVDDYDAGLMLDYSGLYRMSFGSSSLWHNRERLPTASIAPIPGQDLDYGKSYGTGIVISRVNNRIKLGNNPIHLNVNYWQLTREGTVQQIFSDFDFVQNFNLQGATARPIPVDNTTREGTLGLDAHVGPVNAAYSFTVRDFSNQAPDSRNVFTGSSAPQAHNVINDSRATTHIFKLFSDLSGGLTASVLYSLSQRETSTERGDARPSSAPSDTLHTAAGDVSYTPFNELSLNLKYRRLQIDRESPTTVNTPFSTGPSSTLPVSPATNSVKDTLILSASYRPIPKSVYRFEYRAELESRDNLLQSGTTKSDHRQTHTGKASFIWKPINAVKLNASYSYAVTDNPAYPASFGERHSGQALISYTASGRWGMTASYLGRSERGESIYKQAEYPRKSLSTSVNGSAWFSPLEQLTFNASYSFMQSEIDQASLFDYDGNPLVPIRTFSAYRSTAHVYSLDAVAAITRLLDLSLALQQTFSDLRFSASDNSPYPNYSAAGIGDSTRLASAETGLTTRADLHIGKHLGCSLGYSIRKYHAGQTLIDGTAHETLLTMTGRW